MSVYIKSRHHSVHGFSIWISPAQKFCADAFLDTIADLNIIRCERVLENYGPLELVDHYHTQFGLVCIHYEFDEFAGTTIYSANIKLMKRVHTLMIRSGLFAEAQTKP